MLYKRISRTLYVTFNERGTSSISQPFAITHNPRATRVWDAEVWYPQVVEVILYVRREATTASVRSVAVPVLNSAMILYRGYMG